MERAFRLAGLLRLRTLQEEQAAADLAAAHGARQLAEAERQATLGRLAGHAMPTSGGVADWRTATTGRAALAHLLADAGIAVSQADERVGQQAAVWSAARSRSAGLEKLRDKHRSAVAAEDGRAEQHALDEIASRTGTTALGLGLTAPAAPRPTRPAAAPRTQRTALPPRTQEPVA